MSEQEVKGKKKRKRSLKNKTSVKQEEGEVDILSAHFGLSESNRQLIKPLSRWYLEKFSDGKYRSDDLSTVNSGEILSQYERVARRLLEQEMERYRKSSSSRHKSVSPAVADQGGRGSSEWMRTVIKSGTLPDRMAALTVIIQDAPLHHLTALDTLLNMISKKGWREKMIAMDTMKSICLSHLLPDDRKLIAFSKRPLRQLHEITNGKKVDMQICLILWLYESELKQKYEQFIQEVEKASYSQLLEVKRKSVKSLYELLCHKREGEQFLLKSLVNKLGEPHVKVASTVCHLLKQLVSEHPLMKSVIVSEVERLMYRSNIAKKAQYYSVCFLNQIMLDKTTDSALAVKLIQIYFSFFKLCMKNNSSDMNDKMLSALLSGVNRAYPYTSGCVTELSSQIDTLYKMVHSSSNFTTSVQALMLIYQVMDKTCRDRFYTTLYRVMQRDELRHTGKHGYFLHLLYRALVHDDNDDRVKRLMVRLCQACLVSAPQFACASLYLISQVLHVRGMSLLLGPRGGNNDTADTADNTRQYKEISDDDDEHYVDADRCTDETDVTDVDDVTATTNPTSSWVHVNIRNRSSLATSSTHPHNLRGAARNPLSSSLGCGVRGDDLVSVMSLLQHHYHPTAALYAQHILCNQRISYPGNPLQDFTLIRFLDRFVYRNPKVSAATARAGGAGGFLREAVGRPGGEPGGEPDAAMINVTSKDYIETDEARIPVHETFLYRYFKQRAAAAAAGHTGSDDRDGEEDEVEDVSDDEFERILARYEPGGSAGDSVDFSGCVEGTLSRQGSRGSRAGNKKKGKQSAASLDVDVLDDEEVEFDMSDGGLSDISDGDDTVAQTSSSSRPQPDDIESAIDEFDDLLLHGSTAGSAAGTSKGATSHAMARSDNAGDKQVSWEMGRHTATTGTPRTRRHRRQPVPAAVRRIKRAASAAARGRGGKRRRKV